MFLKGERIPAVGSQLWLLESCSKSTTMHVTVGAEGEKKIKTKAGNKCPLSEWVRRERSLEADRRATA